MADEATLAALLKSGWHDDGGDMSSFAARRRLGEKGRGALANVLVGPGELEDEEARAFDPRTGYEHIPGANSALIGLPAMTAGAFKAPRDMAHGLAESVSYLINNGYRPGADDGSREKAIEHSTNAAGVVGSGTFAASRMVGDVGSLGSFIGKNGAKNLAEGGSPGAVRAIAEAERLEAIGLPQDVIRLEVNKIIRKEDPSLGGVWRGDDGMWRVEISDRDARVRNAGPPTSKLGREYNHPQLYQAYPDMPDVSFMRTPDRADSYHKPGDPSEIGIGKGRRASANPLLKKLATRLILSRIFRAAGGRKISCPAGRLRTFLDTARRQLRVIAGYPQRVEKQIVKARIDMSPKERRNTPPWETLERLRATTPNLVPEGPYIPRKGGDAKSNSIGREPDDVPPAFEQAQEKAWEDLAQRGEVGQQPMWSDMGAYLKRRPARRTRPPQSDLWSREANLGLAQMYKRGEQPADIAAKLGNRYTEDQVVSQLEALGLVG